MNRRAVALAVTLLTGLPACHRHHAEPSDALAEGRGVPHAVPTSATPLAPTPTAGARAPLGGRGPVGITRYVEPSPGVAPGQWRARPEPLPPQPAITVTEVRRLDVPVATRDLPGELRGLAGDPTSCVPAEAMATLPEHVHLSLTATVSVSGIITSASVGGNLPAVAMTCVQHRLEQASFPGGVPDAPRTVSATADFDRAPRPTPP